MTRDTLQESLDDALAPGLLDDEVRFIETSGVTCTILECGKDASTYMVVGDGDERAPRCTEHSDQRFRVTDDNKANWALHKLRAARRELADVDTLYQAELDRLNAWRDNESRGLRRSAEFFEHHLVVYGLAVRGSDPEGRERASHALPGGTISFRRSQSVQVDDQEALVAWAEVDHADLVSKHVTVTAIKDLLRKDAAKQLLPVTADGEKVPGIRIERRLNPSVAT